MNRYYDYRCKCPKCTKFSKYYRPFYDHGPCPFVTNIEQETLKNDNFRTALWTGKYLQLTLMSIEDEIGVEMHPNLDQFIRLEQGEGIIMMGDSRDNLNFRREVRDAKETQGDGSSVSMSKPFEQDGMASRLSCIFAAGLIPHFLYDPIFCFVHPGSSPVKWLPVYPPLFSW